MKRVFTLANVRLGVEIALVCAALVLLIGRSTPSTAAPLAEPAGVGWYQCNNPSQVAVFSNRVHVYCASTSPAISGVYWFAAPASPDANFASRAMSLFQSAVLTTQPLLLYLDPSDTTGSAFGCGSGDCRRVYGVELTR